MPPQQLSGCWVPRGQRHKRPMSFLLRPQPDTISHSHSVLFQPEDGFFLH